MSKKILAFGASSSVHSINKKLATWAAEQIEDAEIRILDLNDYEMPIFSVDKESEIGNHPLALKFKEHIKWADGIIISFAEHNGAYSAAFKNIFDWVSRIEKNVWHDKPMYIMGTSPGGRGAKSVIEIAYGKINRMIDNTVVQFSLPSFKSNFSQDKGILDDELLKEFKAQLKIFTNSL